MNGLYINSVRFSPLFLLSLIILTVLIGLQALDLISLEFLTAVGGTQLGFNIFNDWLGLDDPFRDDDRLDPREIERKERERENRIADQIRSEGNSTGGSTGGNSSSDGGGDGGLGALFQPPTVYLLLGGVVIWAVSRDK